MYLNHFFYFFQGVYFLCVSGIFWFHWDGEKNTDLQVMRATGGQSMGLEDESHWGRQGEVEEREPECQPFFHESPFSSNPEAGVCHLRDVFADLMCLLLLFWKHQKDALVVTGIEERFWGSNSHSKSWEKKVHFQYLAGGSSHIFCIFIPNFGEMVRFDEHIFQMGGHQPPTRYSLTCACVNLASESWIRSAVTPTWWWCFLRRDCLHSPRGRQGRGVSQVAAKGWKL